MLVDMWQDRAKTVTAELVHSIVHTPTFSYIHMHTQFFLATHKQHVHNLSVLSAPTEHKNKVKRTASSLSVGAHPHFNTLPLTERGQRQQSSTLVGVMV